MRLIIYTGKGGVGKTSTSAATAYRLSELGYKTLLMSTDSAHSLGDSLDMDLGTTITNVRPNLDALEIDIIHEMKTKWKDIQNYVAAFMLSQGMGEISAEEMAILPGMEMISALFYVNQFEDEGKYDVIVMDTAHRGDAQAAELPGRYQLVSGQGVRHDQEADAHRPRHRRQGHGHAAPVR